MIANLTRDEVSTVAHVLRDPLCGCASGVLAPWGDEVLSFVERCDECARYDDDIDAAEAFALAAGLSVRRRYDDDRLIYWRVFLARPGSVDDRDLYGIGSDEFGWGPLEERPVSELPLLRRLAASWRRRRIHG